VGSGKTGLTWVEPDFQMAVAYALGRDFPTSSLVQPRPSAPGGSGERMPISASPTVGSSARKIVVTST
jgi:hypothetical protein